MAPRSRSHSILNPAFFAQTLGSAVAVLILVLLSAAVRIPKLRPPLDAPGANALMAEEFPGLPIEALWLARDGKGAVARSDDRALVVQRIGDGYVARETAWSDVAAAKFKDGVLEVRFADVTAPRLRLAFDAWPAQQRGI